MELLGARNLGPFYDEADADRSYRQLLEGIVLILPWIATVDAFQHWIYTHPGHTRDERRAAWNGAARPVRRDRRLVGLRGGPRPTPGTASSTSSCTRSITSSTASRSSAPCRSGERSLTDRAGAPSPPTAGPWPSAARGRLPELFAAAGIRFDFGEATLGPLMDAIGRELRPARALIRHAPTPCAGQRTAAVATTDTAGPTAGAARGLVADRDRR